MQQNRRDALAALKITLTSVSGITTVVRSYRGIDISMYTEAQLPLIDIREPAEDTDNQMISFRADNRLSVSLRIYFTSWAESSSSTYETLVKAIRNAIGGAFLLTNTVTKAMIGSLSEIQGEMPLYWIDIDLDISYYLDQKDV